MKMLKKLFFMAMLLLGCSLAYAKGEDFSKLTLKDVNGMEYSFGKSGKETYVKFWASWCPICLSGLEDLNQLSKEKKDFEIVTVVFPGKKGEKSAADFKKWYQSLEYKHIKVLLDEKGDVLKMVNPRVYPTSAVLNKEGKVQRVIPGHLEKMEIEKLFSSSMKKDMMKDDKMMKHDKMMMDKDNMMKDDKMKSDMKSMEKSGASKMKKDTMEKKDNMMKEDSMMDKDMKMEKKTAM